MNSKGCEIDSIIELTGIEHEEVIKYLNSNINEAETL